MTVYVFLGPSLGIDSARAVWDAPRYLPPVRQGDIYHVARQKPLAIAVIDGYFQGVPAVWHKEILWAMAQGIHVFGAASMGALRAAELAAFGMVGVGEIFTAYHSGELADDDEVAVVHGPPELGYRARTEAMVNIRASLNRAALEGVLDNAAKTALIAIAKTLFYQQRDYPNLLRQGRAQGLAPPTLARLDAWLKQAQHRIDQKRLDAVALLEQLRGWHAGAPAPKQVSYRFEPTEAWQLAVSAAETRLAATGSAKQLLLDRLKLDGIYPTLRRQALLRWLTHRYYRHPPAVNNALLAQTKQRLRQTHGLWTRAELDRWLADNQLNDTGFAELIERETELNVLQAYVPNADIDRYIITELQVQGGYAERLRQAQALQQTLAAQRHPPPAPPLTLLAWHCGDRELPDDIERYAGTLGFANAEALYRALRREYIADHGSDQDNA